MSLEHITQIALGNGAYVISKGLYYGEPAVFIEPVPEAGEVGANADHVTTQDSLPPNSFAITFANLASVAVLAEALAGVSDVREEA